MSLRLLIRMEDAGAITRPCDDAGTSKVKLFEVFTGVGQRRDWAHKLKAVIFAESYSRQKTVCAVARRHGLSPSQLFTCRRQLRKQMDACGVALLESSCPHDGAAFILAIIEESPSIEQVPTERRGSRRVQGAAQSSWS